MAGEGVFSDAQLQELAGKAAFGRGRVYHAERRVRLSESTDKNIAGQVEGNARYVVWLKRTGDTWRWACECPAADDGAFCKHLVAAVLTARGDPQDAPATAQDDLGEWLRAQPAARLASWLLTLAQAERDIDKRLRLYRAADDPATLKTALGKALATGGFLDYRGSLRYAQRLDVVIGQLRDLSTREPAQCRVLCEYALGRLFKIYGRSDDSSGAIGECLHAIAQLHALACTAAPPAGKVLAKTLFALQQHDGWGMLPLENYWAALDGEGRLVYGNLVAAEYARLPATPGPGERYGEHLGVLYRAEAYARCARDFDLLQRVLRRDLSHPGAHLQVIESLREFDRAPDALAFAEAAVKRFPQDHRLREALGDCLRAAGLHEENREQRWQAFRMHPDPGSWDALKRDTGDAWPQWRERALAEIAAHERDDATLRVSMLLHDGDIEAARRMAQTHDVWPDTLRRLAKALERDEPVAAGELCLRIVRHQLQDPRVTSIAYPKIVALLKHAARLLPASISRPAIAAVRSDYGRKPKLMALLNEAGL
jgi:hypothetical protein